MTCAACSNTIENVMKDSYSSKGMTEVVVALLTNKMRVTFETEQYKKHGIDPEGIVSEVEMVGFGAEFIEFVET